MTRRLVPLIGCAACALALAPGAARADLRIEERATTLDSSVTRWTSIKGDKRVIVSKADVTGAIYNAGAKYGAYVEVARPDKDLIWDVDPKERTYREVTFEQFNRLLQRGIQAPRTANEQPLRSLYRSQTTAIEVAPTGKTKRIAGYDAEQVMARMVVGAQNQVSGNQFNFTFDQEIWITKDERLLGEIQAFEDTYVEHFGSAATLQQAQLLAGPWNDAFILHLRAMNDRVRALKGFPLASITTVTEEAVAQAKGEKSTSRKFTVATSEVRRITTDTLPESDFDLPVGFVNSDTKVAVAGPTPTPVGTPRVPQPVKPPVVAATPEKPAVVVAKPTPEPEKPVAVAAQPTPEPEKPVAVKPPTPEPPVAAVPRPSVPRVAVNPSPVITGAPTNVIVRGGTVPPPSAAAGDRILVQGFAPPVADNYPILNNSISAATRSAPASVTVDEPEPAPKKGKKRKRSRIPEY